MLTQAEIDALLSGALEAEQPDSEVGVNLAEMMDQPVASPAVKANGRKVRPYNFWSPDRFSKEQMRAVELVHDDLAERLTSSLPSFLHTEFGPRVVHIEQGRFDDFVRDLPPASLFHMLALDPLPGRMVLIISQEIALVILERLLGGSGQGIYKASSLTQIGQSLIEDTVEYMLNDVKAAWSKVVALEPRLEDTTTNHHWVKMAMGNARVMLVTFELAIQDTTGTMGIYIPFTTLKPVASVLNPHVWIAGRDEQQPDPATRQAALKNLHQVAVPVRVLLGTAELTMAELIGLQLGDVIRLDTFIRQNLPVHVGERVRFRARAGTVDNHLAVQIASTVGEAAGSAPEDGR